MSMLDEFFNIRKDSGSLFAGLEIAKYDNLCREWMNQRPVLFLTLKDIGGRTFKKAYGMLQQTISKLCIEHAYLADSSKVDCTDRECFLRLKNRDGSDVDVQYAVDTLLRMMAFHYGKSVILLIDEYDVPLAKASDYGYYEDMMDVMRVFLGMVWKTNPALKFAIVTGCLRIAKESIFTGADNFISSSISGQRYHQYFGFTEPEVRQMLEDAGFPEKLDEMKRWYDGYQFGGMEIYCPWDVVNHVSALVRGIKEAPANYWKDTSHNEIIRRFIDLPGLNVNEKFEILLGGGVIQEQIAEDMTYDIANSSENNLWSILYLTGYLTQAVSESGVQGKTSLRIPNEEVKTIFADTIVKWFADTVTAMDRTELFQAWWAGESGKLTDMVTDILFETISYFDYKEDYYHALLAGLFVGAGYEVSSNQEPGTGRPDVIVKDRKNRRAIIIEIKRSKKEDSMEKDCKKALTQIQTEQYARNLLKGYQYVLCYGIAFFEKSCLIMIE